MLVLPSLYSDVLALQARCTAAWQLHGVMLDLQSVSWAHTQLTGDMAPSMGSCGTVTVCGPWVVLFPHFPVYAEGMFSCN